MSATKPVSSLDNVVVKSPSDLRLYRVIELENGLCALLIHDPNMYPGGEITDADQTDEYEDGEDEEGEEDEDEDEVKGDHQAKAGAAMCVAMGSFLDPPEAQGLAHFLEHILSMGSNEFPDENEFDSYLSKHGGFYEAYTENEHTCYNFEVKREFLHGALKRFSQLFVAPLMKTEAMEREVLAVFSLIEFNQALQKDACRLQQLECHTSGKSHPFNMFAWGNKKSLSGAMEKEVDLRESIVKLYKEYYHGGLMKLVVIGGESLDLLESWVVELFGDVKKGSKIRPTLEAQGPIWKGGKLYRLEAVEDVHILNLKWTLPPLRHAYVKKPELYLAHLLGHEGRGSLFSFLKGKGWVSSLSAAVENDGFSRSSLANVFGISIHLTDSGLDMIYDIIGYIYQYLKLMRDASPQEWIFKELQDIENMDFQVAGEQPADELSENMLAYPVEHVIYGDYVYEIWDPKMIEDLMGFFTPKNMRIDVVSKSVKPQDDTLEFQEEPWFGSRYVEEDVPLSLMETWSNPSQVDSFLQLPSKNQFIPSDFSIRANLDSEIQSSPPKCIIDEPLMKLWYKLDENFKVPLAYTYFHINLKAAYDTVKNCLLTELFINLLKDELREIIYQASVAKLKTFLSRFEDKLELKVYGFNEKIPALLSKILTIANSFMPRLERFKVIKENMERGYRNINMNPLNHSTDLIVQLLCKGIYDNDDKLSVLNDLSLTDLNIFIPQLRSQMYIEALCHGNLSEDEAVNISNIFKTNLTVETLPIKSRHVEQITCFPQSAKLVRDVNVKNKSETNSVIELYYQIEPEEAQSTRVKAMLLLFHEIIKEPFFNQLRTKEQLGYVVGCCRYFTYRVHGYCFYVQSSKYGPVHLLGRVDNFLKDIERLLEEIDEESFEDYRSGVIAKLLDNDDSPLSETNELWSQISHKRYMFDYSSKETQEVKSIQKKDLINWYKTYFGESSPKCRRLAARVWGCNTDMKKDAPTDHKSVHVITDVVAFKSTSQFYPSLC